MIASIRDGTDSVPMPEITIDVTDGAIIDANAVLGSIDTGFVAGASLTETYTSFNVLWSSSSGIPAASIFIGAVPIPGALLLFGSALGPLGFAAVRRRGKLNKKMLKNVCALVFVLVVADAKAFTITHYDIDFGSRPHTVGSLPTVGTSSDKVSSINFGHPVVESTFGSLSHQPLVFTADNEGMDQIQLNLARGHGNYHASFNVQRA